MFCCDLLKSSTTFRSTSICVGFAPVPSPTYHLTTVRPPAAAGSKVLSETGVCVGATVVCANVWVWATGADSALEPVRARTSSVAPHVRTARLSIGTSLVHMLRCRVVVGVSSGFQEAKVGAPLPRTDPPFARDE